MNLNINYKKFVPLESTVRVTVETEKREGKKLYIKARMESEKGELHSTATALFLQSGENYTYEDTLIISRKKTKEQTIQSAVLARSAKL